tara:strand:+ start:310 stop:468 length:159 start_codon:yes stop_codon:yes gene_type:complete
MRILYKEEISIDDEKIKVKTKRGNRVKGIAINVRNLDARCTRSGLDGLNRGL